METACTTHDVRGTCKLVCMVQHLTSRHTCRTPVPRPKPSGGAGNVVMLGLSTGLVGLDPVRVDAGLQSPSMCLRVLTAHAAAIRCNPLQSGWCGVVGGCVLASWAVCFTVCELGKYSRCVPASGCSRVVLWLCNSASRLPRPQVCSITQVLCYARHPVCMLRKSSSASSRILVYSALRSAPSASLHQSLARVL
jgi:hypothetical protein